MNNKGRTEALALSISELFQIQPRNIEIGSSLVHKYGANVHVVHMVNQLEIDVLEQNESNEFNVNGFYTKHLCMSMEKELSDLFTSLWIIRGI